MPDFLPHVPADAVLAALSRAAGNEIASGKFDSAESSQALTANAFGRFLEHPALLPALPGVPVTLSSAPAGFLLGIPLGVLAAVLTWLVMGFDANRYKGIAIEWMQTHHNRTLTINGPIGLSLFPRLQITLADVALSEAEIGRAHV
mgnify:CR=1 FL=1